MPRVSLQVVVGLCLFMSLSAILYSLVYEEKVHPIHITLNRPINATEVILQETLRHQILRMDSAHQQIVTHPVMQSGSVATVSVAGVEQTPQKRSFTKRPPSPKQYNQTCSVKNHLVFLKTHKTGSTTIATIFERYGFYNNLTFALPPTRHFYEPVQDLFKRTNMAQIENKYLPAFNNNTWNGYHLLTNHVRYNRPEMDAVVHNAIYVTILRSPVEQFESAFGYYEMAKYTGLAAKSNPIASFMEKPDDYFKKHFTAWYWSKNAQLYDLGIDHIHHGDPFTLNYKINQLDAEFDLVLITEYFDESLLLLRKLMCWEWSDILYLPKGIRSSSHRQEMAPDLRSKILAWNSADAQLYDNFNRTLWRKIREYGPEFGEDLAFLRAKLDELRADCIAVNMSMTGDKREVKMLLKTDADELCYRVYRDDVAYTRMIRAKMAQDGLLFKRSAKKTAVKIVKVPFKKYYKPKQKISIV